MEDSVAKLAKHVGIGATVLGGIFLLGLGFMAYRNYFEVVKLKLEIEDLKRTLNKV